MHANGSLIPLHNPLPHPPPTPSPLYSLAIIMVEILTHDAPYHEYLDYVEVQDILDAVAGRKTITSQLPQAWPKTGSVKELRPTIPDDTDPPFAQVCGQLYMFALRLPHCSNVAAPYCSIAPGFYLRGGTRVRYKYKNIINIRCTMSTLSYVNRTTVPKLNTILIASDTFNAIIVHTQNVYIRVQALV